jgi:hypothetical protein
MPYFERVRIPRSDRSLISPSDNRYESFGKINDEASSDMGHETLAVLRFVTPGLIILIAYSMAGNVTGLWTFQFEWSIDAAYKSVPGLVAAMAYYVVPLRTWSNAPFMDRINEHVRSKVVAIGGISDDLIRFPWPRVSPTFYRLIDSDESLGKKSSLVRLNGYILSTVADVRAVAVVLALLCVPSTVEFGARASLSILTLLVLAALTWPVSYFLTKRHIQLADEQLEVMQQNHSDAIRASLGRLT